MKAQFKYAFFAGLYFRGPVFAVIFVMNTVFITLGSLGLLPFAAHVTAVSLGGLAIAVMFAANIGGDVAVARRMFTAPEAYLLALTPGPRWKTLLASIVTMTVMDIFTMAFVIVSQVWLALNLAGGNNGQIVWNIVHEHNSYLYDGFLFILLLIAGYLLLIMVILFCVTAKKSIFFKMPASGFLAFLLACGCFYIVNLLQFVLVPFSEVQRFGLLIILTLSSTAAIPFLILLTLLEAVILFVLTSKLLERKVNL
jgi:hypothetical protein